MDISRPERLLMLHFGTTQVPLPASGSVVATLAARVPVLISALELSADSAQQLFDYPEGRRRM